MSTIKIKKEDFDKELQKAYTGGRFFVFFRYKKWRIKLFNFLLLKQLSRKKRQGVITEYISIKSKSNTHKIPVVIYKPKTNNKPLPIMLYMHGGGYVSGTPEMSPGLEDLIAKRPCIIVAPKYRKALTAPYPAALDDCYDTLLWIKENGKTIGGANNNIMVVGHSAGGGLAAAVTLKNRDKKDINIAFQMPLYPMLDYRNNTKSALACEDIPFWNTKSNEACWNCYLENLNKENKPIPYYASPALNKDYSNFPPTVTFVGGLEPFKDEVISYVENLKKAQIPTKFELFSKAYHGFEAIIPNAKISLKAKKFLMDAYSEYYDKCYQ